MYFSMRSFLPARWLHPQSEGTASQGDPSVLRGP